jgi:hypothetical protein
MTARILRIAIWSERFFAYGHIELLVASLGLWDNSYPDTVNINEV